MNVACTYIGGSLEAERRYFARKGLPEKDYPATDAEKEQADDAEDEEGR